ncbi:MAG TPA: hypothetical protein VFQ45_14040, partial [Longimicrobium sp.]|nr:hypothetical protein [Longimicrobium sp.]
MGAWMLYAAAAGALAAVAAAALERVMRMYRRPTRWVWAAALAATLSLAAATAVGREPIPATAPAAA